MNVREVIPNDNVGPSGGLGFMYVFFNVNLSGERKRETGREEEEEEEDEFV